MIIAGEASGDLHASHLMSAIAADDPEAVFTFFGGDRMAAVAGRAPAVHYKDMAYMGFSEVIRNLGKVRRNLSLARKLLERLHPDCLICVDYPSFNLKVAATAHGLGIPVYYFIAPKVWAWKKWRLRDLRRLCRRVLSILPFEPEFFAANGAEAEYVGNPSVGEVDSRLAAVEPRDAFLAKWRLRDRPLVALMPGSRRGEIRNNLAVMNEALDRFPQYRGVVICAPGIEDEFYSACGSGQLPLLRPGDAVEVLAHSRAALVTSGTATLECALAGVPQVVMYRGNGSKATYEIMRRVLSVDKVSLPNLIAGHEIVPELLLHMCTAESVADSLAPLLREDTLQRRAQLEGYADMRSRLGIGDAAATAAAIIVGDLKKG